MSNYENEQSPVDGPEVKASKARKPYQKPMVRFERVFETRALTCGKVEISQQQCKTSRKTS